MLDFQKCGVLAGRLIDPEMPHHSECSGAFQRSPERRVGYREVGLFDPPRHLRRIQEETAGMRVPDALKDKALTEQWYVNAAVFLDVLLGFAGALVVHIPVNIQL